MAMQQTDHLKEAAAYEMARNIYQYWSSKGYHIEARVYKIRGGKEGHSAYGVRTNLINGLPPDHALHKEMFK
jgi:hypothetical protein